MKKFDIVTILYYFFFALNIFLLIKLLLGGQVSTSLVVFAAIWLSILREIK